MLPYGGVLMHLVIGKKPAQDPYWLRIDLDILCGWTTLYWLDHFSPATSYKVRALDGEGA